MPCLVALTAAIPESSAVAAPAAGTLAGAAQLCEVCLRTDTDVPRFVEPNGFARSLLVKDFLIVSGLWQLRQRLFTPEFFVMSMLKAPVTGSLAMGWQPLQLCDVSSASATAAVSKTNNIAKKVVFIR